MSALAVAHSNVAMSSLDVAEITGKRHFHVLRDIRQMIDTLKIDGTKFGAIFSDQYGRPLHGFKLPQREFLILASGYSVELRAKLVDRWIELETAARAPQANDARLAALEARVAALEAKPAPRAPAKPDAAERILEFVRERGAVSKREILRRFQTLTASERDRAIAQLKTEGRVAVVLVHTAPIGRPASVCRWVQ